MRNFFALSVIILIIMTACGGNAGELVGVYGGGKRFIDPQPYGMVLIPQGSFVMGPNDQDVAMSMTSQAKTVSIGSFWMDETEVTNAEYRQFVGWVKDSTARRILGDEGGYTEFLITEDYYGNPIEPPLLNWAIKLYWDDPEFSEILEDMYYPEEDRFSGSRQIDPRKLTYEYQTIDFATAVKSGNRYNFETGQYDGFVYDENREKTPIENRSAFIKTESVYVYPDTLCWMYDFTYTYNDPFTKTYFWHPGFHDYPVVGVNWKQASAFCVWRTTQLNKNRGKRSNPALVDYRLPTEGEWEYASRGGLENAIYPWAGIYTRNAEGCFLANFKPLRGRYTDDGAQFTSKIMTFIPNGFGLFDMAGNVAEWTASAFNEASYAFTHDFNPTYTYNARDDEPVVMKRKVVRGGSWKDVGYFLQNSTRAYEYQDSVKSYIGFRCVRDYMGAFTQE